MFTTKRKLKTEIFTYNITGIMYRKIQKFLRLTLRKKKKENHSETVEIRNKNSVGLSFCFKAIPADKEGDEEGGFSQR